MKVITKIILGVIITLGTWTQAFGADVVLRYSAWLPPTYFMHERALYKYFSDINKVTEGRVKVEISSAPLGPPPRNYKLAVDGVADITWGPHGFTPGTFPLSEMAELPFHSTDAETNSKAYWRVFKKYLEPAGMHPGVHTLTVHVHPPGQLFNSVRPIAAPDDFKGLKFRTTNTGISDAVKLLGATPVGMPVTQMRDALSKGIVDGVSLTDEALRNFKIVSLVKYELAVTGGLYNTSFFLVVNKAKWDSISPKDQKAIMEISGEALAGRMGKIWQAEQDQATAKVVAAGIKINKADGALLEFIKSRLVGQDDAWLKKAKAAGVDGKAALEMYRAANAK